MKFGVYYGGWLVDTSGRWSFNVNDAQWFDSVQLAVEALEGMVGNGHEIKISKAWILRLR